MAKKINREHVAAIIYVSPSSDEADLTVVQAKSEDDLLKKLRLYLIGTVQSYLAELGMSKAKSVVNDALEELLDEDSCETSFSPSPYEGQGFIQVIFNPCITP